MRTLRFARHYITNTSPSVRRSGSGVAIRNELKRTPYLRISESALPSVDPWASRIRVYCLRFRVTVPTIRCRYCTASARDVLCGSPCFPATMSDRFSKDLGSWEIVWVGEAERSPLLPASQGASRLLRYAAVLRMTRRSRRLGAGFGRSDLSERPNAVRARSSAASSATVRSWSAVASTCALRYASSFARRMNSGWRDRTCSARPSRSRSADFPHPVSIPASTSVKYARCSK